MKNSLVYVIACLALVSFTNQAPNPSYTKLVAGVYSGIYKSNAMPNSVLDFKIEVVPTNDSVAEIKVMLPNQSRSFTVILYSADNELDANGNPVRLEIKSPTANFDRKGYFYPAIGMIHYTFNGINSDPANFEIFTGEKE